MNTITNEIVKINPSDYGLEESKAAELIKNLSQIINERGVFVSQFDMVIRMDIEDPETAKKARELRLRIRDNRTKGIEVWHKTTKDFFLSSEITGFDCEFWTEAGEGGQFVDAIKRMEVVVNERMEIDLEKIEKYQENLERERTERLRLERSNLLKQYTDIEPLALGHMEQSVFDNYLAGVKLAHETKIAAEKKAEEDRIAKEKADAEEKEAQRLGNIRLKAEAEEKERLAAIERKKNERILAAQKAKADKERAELLAKAEVERKEKERLEKEIADKKAAENKAKRDTELKILAEQKARAAEEKKAKLAPDKDKLLSLADQLDSFKLPKLESSEAEEILKNIKILISKTTDYIRQKANQL